jgi:hypothetical protein
MTAIDIENRLREVGRELTFTLGSKAYGYSDILELAKDFAYVYPPSFYNSINFD